MKKNISHLKKLAIVLDDSIRIPGTNYRIGVDAIVGLVPGIGDVAGAIMSAYIVIHAAYLGVSWPTLARMMSNVLFEGVVGSVPFVGDAIDAAYKANMRNMRLIEREIDSGRALRSSKLMLIGAAVALVFILVLIVALVFVVMQGLLSLLGS